MPTLDELTTEAVNPASMNLDQCDSLALVRLMNTEDGQVVQAVAEVAQSIAAAIDRIAARLAADGRLIYLGAGTSGRLGMLDAAECPPTFSSSPDQVRALIAGGSPALCEAVEGAEDDAEAVERDLQGIELASGDALVAISASGSTPYALGGLRYARKQGALTIALSCNRDSELQRLADLAITPVVGPEVLTGSTRLKAGSATKMVLNMLSTGVMVRLGKVYGNRMVDLRASNAKLRARSLAMVVDLGGVDPAAAAEVLHNCAGELKTALVCVRKGVGPTKARQLLIRAQGRLGEVFSS